MNNGEQCRTRCATWALPETLRELNSGCEGLVSDLIELFMTDTAARLERVRRATTVVDRSVLKAEMHSIKGSARQIGADVMASTCEEIELATVSCSISNLAESVGGLEADFVGVCGAMSSFTTCSASLPL